jgi:hypothetical protein
MPQIIYSANPSGLIAQGDRSVTTYPSGLLKVEQTFIGLTANESTDRLTLQIGQAFPLDDSPSIDGVFIFPATQESRDSSGFTTYRVSGYGRINENGYSEISPSENLVASTIETIGESTFIYSDIWSAKQKLTQRVIFNDQEDEDPNGYDTQGVPLPIKIETSQYPVDIPWALTRVDVQRTNYGRFTELRTLAKYQQGTILNN